ncbi:MAG TPA: FAD-dependent oxidoreductase [Verrucomicrobiae bacterium]|nr:FAD-dependent oxidoreductase [Verrucomicrobiae bacterium]
MKVAVIGAGPAGMSAAYKLCKSKIPAQVFEAGPSVGGLAKTIELWGQKVDLGPHRFLSSDRRVNELWLEVVGADYRMVHRLTRIVYRGKFFHYPLKPLEAFAKLGPLETPRCIGSYIKARFSPLPLDGSFEAWVVNRFGRRLFEIFFKSYSEKLWGISCRKLDADFAAQRIKKLTLSEAVKNALRGGRQNRHKTLADEFAYPIGGTGMVYERMVASVKQNGGQVHCRQPVRRVLVENNRATGIELDNGTVEKFDHIVSTMPITQLVSQLPGVPEKISRSAESLKFRNTVLVYLEVDSENLFPDNWVYIHSPDLQMGRISNFRNWVPELHGPAKTTILAIEYWCYDDDALWQQEDKKTIALASQELPRTGLVNGARILSGHVLRIKRCYPVYDIGYKQRLRPVEEYLSGISGLSVIGRYGAFKYNNQDHSILMGILAAENIASGSKHNLWEVNTDYDIYQEATCITKTGLRKQE